MKKEFGVLLTRVSSKEQAEGFSMLSQNKLGKQYAEANNIHIERIFEISETASRSDERKIFAEIFSFLKKNKHVKNFLVEKIDRLTRNFRDAITVEDWFLADEERRVHFIKQQLIIHSRSSSHDMKRWDEGVKDAKFYTRNLSEEVRKGIMAKAESGWYPGNMKRGYKTVGKRHGKTWVIDDSAGSEAPYISRIWVLLDAGHSLDTIRTMLHKDGWMRSNGDAIGKKTLHEIARDPFYYGAFSWMGKLYKGNHQPLVSKERWTAGVLKMTRKMKQSGLRKHQFLFKGLLTCDECGRSFAAEIQKGHVYYRCTRYKTNCTQRGCVRETDLENDLLMMIDQVRIQNPRLLEWVKKALKLSHEQQSGYQEQSRTDLQAALSKINHRMTKVYDDYLDQVIDKDFYELKMNDLRMKKQDIESKLEKVNDSQENFYELGSYIFELAQNGLTAYKNCQSVEEKRRFIKFLLTNFRVHQKKLVADWQNSFSIHLYSSKMDLVGQRTRLTNVIRDWRTQIQSPRSILEEAKALYESCFTQALCL